MVLATCLRELTAHAAGTYLAGGRRIVYRRAGENACARRHGIICVRQHSGQKPVSAHVSLPACDHSRSRTRSTCKRGFRRLHLPWIASRERGCHCSGSNECNTTAATKPATAPLPYTAHHPPSLPLFSRYSMPSLTSDLVC